MKFNLDEPDQLILKSLVDNPRIPYTEIAQGISFTCGTVNQRIKKMEDTGIILGFELSVDYKKFDYFQIAYVGIYINKTSNINSVLTSMIKIPYITTASVILGKFSVFCKINARNTSHLQDIIFKINAIDNVFKTETIVSLEESINDDNRLMLHILEHPFLI
ncbi:Lrp/AsnC family transcriptional regulator for asnA, asnC and gidA [Flavobacterium sp. 9]|uniref:Lrp/AsnC family transcriptional regulator n=1 Tax=Flavobacterium sp. 9 TaxID=2035198 RepID=UPI000C174C27|nr:winged helix-turn-helix transcriptional regulator [Flavobacterium sp. 9]PIF30168.1 Lrp/AsnC family transcriptional regulator for asnA, asnC and gidA [Flavobacterium sp. 9]